MPTDRTQARKASGVYAQTLFEAAQRSDTVFEVADQLAVARSTLRGSIRLRETLADNGLTVPARRLILAEVFAGFSTAVLAVLGVMVERGDLGLLARVSEAYVERAETVLKVVIIEVTTAVSLDDSLRESLCATYASQFGSKVVLREQVDPSIVGGIVLSARGKRIDASVVSQLERARVALSMRS